MFCLVVGVQLRVGRLGLLLQLIQIQQRVRCRALLGHLIAAHVFREVSFQLGVRRIDRGREIRGFEHRVFDGDFLVAPNVFLRDLRIRDGHAVGENIAEFFFKKLLADEILKIRDRHSRARLDFLRVAFFAHPGIAVERRGNIFLDALGLLFRRDFQAQALRLELQRFLVDEFINDLPGVQALHRRRQRLPAQLAIEHVLDVGARNLLVAHARHSIRAGRRGRPRHQPGHQSNHHGKRDHDENHSHQNLHASLPLLNNVEHFSPAG